MGIKHTFTSAIPDTNDPTKVRPSNWNDDHTIDGDVDFQGHAILNADLPDAGAGEFTELTDVPATYAGSGNKLVAVNSGATGLTFVEPSAGGPVDAFTDLLDVPGSYSGQGGKVATVNSGETALEFTESSSGLDWVTPQQYGAVADGTSHPLSGFYVDLAEAQAAYGGAFYFINSLTQEMDYAAVKAASNECFGSDGGTAPAGDGILGGGNEGDYLPVGAATTSVLDGGFSFYIDDGEPNLTVDELAGYTAYVTYGSAPGYIATSLILSNTTRKITCASAVALSPGGSMYAYTAGGEHGNNSHLNKTLYFPAGTYHLGNDTWLIRNLRSGTIRGAGKLVSVVEGSGEAVLQFDGVWYTTISDMAFDQQNSASIAALDIDGNVPGHPYTTRGVQGCTLSNLAIGGGEATFAMSLNRQGGGGAQGSEMLYLNLHLYAGEFACYGQYGFNALANTFIGGNFQNYGCNGIYVVSGTFAVFNTGFQSTRYFEQYTNGGYDIRCGDSGAYEGCPITGCRTEGSRFLYNTGAVRCVVSGIVGTGSGAGNWSALTTFGSAIINREWISVTSADGYSTFMVATTAGTSGAAQPTWPDMFSGATVNDGSVVWTEVGSGFIYNGYGSTDYQSCAGPGMIRGYPQQGILRNITGQYVIDGDFNGLTYRWLDTSLCAKSTTAGPITLYLPRYENYLEGRTANVIRADDGADDVIINSFNLGYHYKNDTQKQGVSSPGLFYLPRAEGAQTWISRASSADGYGAWMLLSSMYLEDLTSEKITDQNGNELVEFGEVASAENHVKVTNAVTTAPPLVEAAGSDTNVDLQLAGKGTGLVRYGVHNAVAAETVTGYITIKDAAGNPRKLAVLS